ncbi:hypothetical protein ACT2CV_00460 [Pasteurellaceae bacterium 22721_9_1]
MMKKLLLLLLTSLALPLSAVQKNAILPQDIIGEWTCRILYRDINIETMDNLDFQEDGKIVAIGYTLIKKDFMYENKHIGQWYLQDNMLSELIDEFEITRLHSKQTEKRLRKEPRLAQWEDTLFYHLKNGMNQGDIIDFSVTKFDKENMEIQHIWENQKRYPGICKKKNKS